MEKIKVARQKEQRRVEKGERWHESEREREFVRDGEMMREVERVREESEMGGERIMMRDKLVDKEIKDGQIQSQKDRKRARQSDVKTEGKRDGEINMKTQEMV